MDIILILGDYVMKKSLMMASSALALVMSVSAFAGGPDNMPSSFTTASSSSESTGTWYAGVQGGVSMLIGDLTDQDGSLKYGDETKAGFNAGLTVGYAVNNNVSVEAQGFYVSNDGEDEGDGETANEYVFMGNVKYAFDMGGMITPYIGAGFGYIGVDTSDDSWGATPNVDVDGQMGYQVLAGVAYALNQQMDLTLDYHFVGPIGSQDIDDSDAELNLPMMNVGFTYKF